MSKIFDEICWSGNFDPEIVRQKFNELISNKTIKYTKVQLKWLRYRWLYREYRSCTDKGQRRKILKEIKTLGQNITWICDPMHGNTIKSSNGYKTRKFDDILSEIKSFDNFAFNLVNIFYSKDT